MRYVIIRDDDTNALTPVSCLEQLYRPFLERGLPVNLATIPEVALDTSLEDGKPEGFLAYRNGTTSRTVPIGAKDGCGVHDGPPSGGVWKHCQDEVCLDPIFSTTSPHHDWVWSYRVRGTDLLTDLYCASYRQQL